ncbi:MAG: hypothetical protein DRJ01_10530 [Bacteroidetes bacterium]|nr:MAG: hypothetical protein DRJ01_10530 [Bacteroidota bacterium]
MKKLLLSTFILLVFVSGSFSQSKYKYQKFQEEKGVIFYYKYSHSNFLNKKSPLRLILKIENTNAYNTKVNFVVDYYWKAMISANSEKPRTCCVKANKSIKGRYHKLHFEPSEYTNEQVLSDDFFIELSGIEITKVDDCIKNK